MTVHPRPEWRRALYRFRHLIAAVAVLAGLLIAVRAFAPGVSAYALGGDTRSGTVLTAAQIVEIRVSRDSLPGGVFTEPPVGEQLLIDLPARTILTESLVTPRSLADLAPPDTLVFPIALADAGSRALAQPGRTVSLVADRFDGGAEVVDGVEVIAVFEPDSSALFSSPDQGNTVAVVAVPRNYASFILSVSGSRPVRVAVSP